MPYGWASAHFFKLRSRSDAQRQALVWPLLPYFSISQLCKALIVLFMYKRTPCQYHGCPESLFQENTNGENVCCIDIKAKPWVCQGRVPRIRFMACKLVEVGMVPPGLLLKRGKMLPERRLSVRHTQEAQDR